MRTSYKEHGKAHLFADVRRERVRDEQVPVVHQIGMVHTQDPTSMFAHLREQGTRIDMNSVRFERARQTEHVIARHSPPLVLLTNRRPMLAA